MLGNNTYRESITINTDFNTSLGYISEIEKGMVDCLVRKFH